MAIQSSAPSKAIITSVGSATSGGTEDSLRPVITGTADAGTVISVYDGARSIGTTLVNADGSWSFTPAADLKVGKHQFSAISMDGDNWGPSSSQMSVTLAAAATVPNPPVITGLIDDVGPITGQIKPNGTTDDPSPALTGKGTAGDVITLHDGNNVIGSATVDANGNWSVKPVTPLNDGAHDVYATETNATGTSAPSVHVPFTVDTSTPATPAAPIITDDSGALIPAGSTTADTHPHISGDGTAGDTVTVLDNGTVIGSTTVQPDGTWTFTPDPDLNSGPHDITVIDTNAAGTPSLPSNPTHITVDPSVPVAPATPTLSDDNGANIPAGSTTNDAHPHINGTGVAGDIIKVFDGANVIGTAKVDANGKWSFTPNPDLSNAPHSISVTEVNAAGTESPHSGSIGFTIDTTLPNAPTITEMNDYRFDNGALITAVPSGSTITSANVAFGGHATANGVVYVYDGNTMIASVKADATGYWFYASKAYANGVHDMSATQKSPAGVETAHSNHWSFNLNAVTPATPGVPVITNDAGTVIPTGGTTNDAHPHINGNGTAGDVITVMDNGTVIGSTTVAGNGTWSFNPSDLPNGATAITVTETNPAGNASAVSPPATFTIDTSIPAKPPVPVLTDDGGALIPAGSTTSDGHPHISGNGPAGDTITVYDGSTVLGTAKVDSNGKWTFTPSSDVSTGTHSISVTDTNAAGTTGPKSDAIAFTFSLVPGAPVITSIVDAVGTITGPIPNGGVTDDNHPTVSGTGVAGYTIYIYQNGAGCGSAIVDATGHWALKLTGALSEGLHVMTATQFIGSNPASAASNSWNITVDTSTPATPATPTLSDDNGLSIPAGSTTSDGHPHINGTGKAGDTITVYDGSTVLGTAKVDSNGKWVFTPSSDVAIGQHSISVTETNPAGTASAMSGAIAFNYSLVPGAPVITSVIDAVGTITGPIPNGGVTDDTNPTFHGTGIPGDTVYLYSNGRGCGDTVVQADGTWTIKVNNYLTIGVNVMTATQFTNASNPSPASNSWTLTLDTSVPAKPAAPNLTDDSGAAIAAGSTTADAHPHINGNGTAGDVITVLDNGTVIGSTTVKPDGTWSFTPNPDMNSGPHDITVTDTNAAGTPSLPSNPTHITIDTSVPAKPVLSLTDDSGAVIPSGSTTTDGHPHISGTGKAGDIVKVYDGAALLGSVAVDGTGHWTFTPSSDVSIGTHSLTATETNAAGTVSPTSDPYLINFSPIVTPTETVAITGLVDHLLAGVVVTNGGSTADSAPTVQGKISSPLLDGETLQVYRDGQPVGKATVSGTGWTFNDSGVSAGSHSYTAQVQNQAGNGPLSSTFSFTESAPPFDITSVSLAYEKTKTFIGIDIAETKTGTFWGYLTGNTYSMKVYAADGTLVSTLADHAKWGQATNGFIDIPLTSINPNYYYVVSTYIKNVGPAYVLSSNKGSTYLNLPLFTPNATMVPLGTDFPPAWGNVTTGLQATHMVVDDHAQASSISATDSDSAVTPHAVVGEHDAFKGTTGHDTVDLSADPASYFKETTAHIEGSTVHAVDPATGTATAVNTLHLTGDHQVLDLTSLTGKTAAAKISGIEAIDLGGQHNTLKLSLVDVLNLGEADLFMKDGKQQVMVQGKEGDEVDLSNAHIAGVADGQWEAHGTEQVGGVTYNVYEHTAANTELLVEHTVRIEMH